MAALRRERESGHRSAWPFVVALVVAGICAAVAPAPWTTGAGSLELVVRGADPVSIAVQVGVRDPIRFVQPLAGATGRRLLVELPTGVPHTEIIRARIRMEAAGSFVELSPAAVTVRVQLPDGRRELIPATGWDAESRSLLATRRPPRHAPVVLGLLGMTVVLWLSGAVPLFVASLLVPAVLVLFGVARLPAAFAPFFDPVIALFFGGFLLAKGMQRVGLDRSVAVAVVARAGRSPGVLFAALLGTSAFLSMWMSNTAATAVLIPIALAITQPLASRGYRKACVLGIAYAATIGGVGSLIGTPANPIAAEFLARFAGQTVTFLDWFAYGLPFVAVFLPIMGVVLWRKSDTSVDAAVFAAAHEAAVASPPVSLRRNQGLVLGVFVLVVAAWLTQAWHGVSPGFVAVGGAVLLALLRQLEVEDLRTLSWSSLITFGGALALGVYLGETGVSDWLATRMELLVWIPTWMAVAAVALCALALTTVASNTASAALFVPLSIPLASILGVDVGLLVLTVAIATSIDFALVMGTPPTMIAYSTGLFTPREIFRAGLLLDILGVVVLLTAVTAIWHWLGVV